MNKLVIFIQGGGEGGYEADAKLVASLKKALGEDYEVRYPKLQEGFAERLPENVPVFLYHSRDDEEIPFTHLEIYAQKLLYATIQKISKGGHQLNNNLAIVAKDIKSL